MSPTVSARPVEGQAKAARSTPRHVVVAGGGIGGLAAGLALARGGWRVTVLEQAAMFGEVGAGVQISPNGTRCLEALGVMERLEGALFEPQSIELRLGHSGRRMFSLPLREKAMERWGGRYVHIHRADLAEGLKDALEAIAPDALTYGKTVTEYRQEGARAIVILDDGEELTCDLLVGADGVHSRLRGQMLGGDPATFTGMVAWRTTVPVDRFTSLPPPTACIWTGHGRHAVTTRIRGGSVVNFVGIVEEDGWEAEGWNQTGERADALAAFDGFAAPVREVLEQCDSLNRWALLGRPPLPRWSDGQVVLVGDAAHPMLPSLAQGAVQAIEDAVALGEALEGVEDVPAALNAFYKCRIARVTRVQKESAKNAKMFHHGNPLMEALVYGPMALATAFAPGFVRARNDWLFGGGPL
jgi:salicylate hydroxylase